MSYEKLSSAIGSQFPDEWYSLNLADNFWFAWRITVLERLFKDCRLPLTAPQRVLEIGCGIGFLRTQIEAISAWTVDGADVKEEALQQVACCRGRTLLYNIEDKRPDLKDHYDGLVLFDVLEHIEHPEAFMAAALWHLKPGGWIAVNVPALTALFSQYDQQVGHFRRYNATSMRKFLTTAALGVVVKDIRYWGFSLIPVAAMRKFALRHIQSPQEAVAKGFNPPARWINTLFLLLMRLETRLIRRPPLGSSLMVLAHKAVLNPITQVFSMLK